tara:strand:+ start:6006 stop:8027 length:2022 start_codon:yes stop_codon:yes gene_type:complete
MIKIQNLEIPELEAEDVRNEYTQYDHESDEFRFQMAEDYDFYLGKQLTEAQKEYLMSVGQPPESNNKIRPAVEQVLSNMASTKPEWDVEGVGSDDGRIAGIYNKILDEIWYSSKGDTQFRTACKDFIVKGLCYLYVYPDYQADNGLGGIRFKRIKPEAVFVDPNSSLPDFSDASSIIYTDLHTKESLKVLFPDIADKIDDLKEDYDTDEETSGNYNRDDIYTRGDATYDQQPTVRKFVRFAKVSIPSVLVTELVTGKSQIFDKEAYEELQADKKYQELIDQGSVTEKIIYTTKVRETCVVGDLIYYDEILPIDSYPIIPACNEHTGTPYPSGDVRHAKSPQRMLNRTEALLISHTSATTNFKLVVEDGAIDPKELQKWNIPNAIIRANPGALRDGKIKEYAPPAVSSQLFTEKSRYELDIEQVFGSYKFLQGYGEGSPGTVGEAQIIEESVSKKQGWKVMPVYDMLTIAGKIISAWIPFVYNQERVVRITSPNGMMEDVRVNEAVMNKNGEIERLYDITTNSIDIRVVVGSTKAKSPMADLQRDIQLMGAGIYDKTQVIMNMRTDDDKASLIQRHGEISQYQQTIQGLQEQVKKLSGDLQTRERELFHTKMRAEVSEATKNVSQAVSNIKATSKIEEERQRNKTQQVASDLANAANSVNSEKQAPEPKPSVIG